MQEASSLVHLIRKPAVASGSPPLLLLLHGLGGNERSLMGLAARLDGRFFCVSARAPYTVGQDSFAWFDVDFTAEGPVIDEGEAEESRVLLLRFIAGLKDAYGIDPQRVYLLGFSQGAIMSLCAALTAPEAVAGIAAMSGRLLPEILPLIVPPDRLRGLPIFLSHGLSDEVLPIELGRAARDRLARLPVALEYNEYNMRHEISEECFGDMAAWLGGRLDQRP